MKLPPLVDPALRCSVLIVCALVPACSATADSRPNVVLLVADDHGWAETGYNGHPHVRTPVLDEMAASGLRLDRFYAAAPVCSPTRGSVITGRHPNRYGTFGANWSIRPEEIGIARILGEAGYATAHFGKWHLGPVKAGSPTNPGAMGFQEWLSHDNFFEIDPPLSRNGAPHETFRGESSEVLIEETIRFIERTREDSGRPFFAAVWFGSPHEPYVGLEKDLALYEKLPNLYRDRLTELTSVETGQQVQRPLGEVLQERYAEITAMDRAIGHLRRYLDEQGLGRNTILWYFGDNGAPVSGLAASPLRAWKGWLYEGGILVPGILEWPERIPRSRTTDVAAVTTDVVPTLCDLLGLHLPEGRPIDGVSLVPLIDGTMSERDSPIYFWSYDTRPFWSEDPRREQRQVKSGLEPYIAPELQEGTTPMVKLLYGRLTRNFWNFRHPDIRERDFVGPKAVLDGRYKLVINGDRSDEAMMELFDVRNDPAEQKDLAQTRPGVVRDLEDEIRQWQRSVLESLTGADYR